MADNFPTPEKDSPKATETGRVVSLSSVAKTPPPLPPAQKQPAPSPDRPQLNRTVEVKLPPKSGVQPKLTTLPGVPTTPVAPAPLAGDKNAPPPPPVGEKKQSRFSSFKLKPLFGSPSAEESIFPEPGAKEATPAPAREKTKEASGAWKHLEPGELPLSADEARSRQVFESTKLATAKTVPPLTTHSPSPGHGATAPPLLDPPSSEKLAPPVRPPEPQITKVPALSGPAPSRQLAPPFPKDAVRKTPPAIPPPSANKVTPSATGTGIVSALKKTGATVPALTQQRAADPAPKPEEKKASPPPPVEKSVPVSTVSKSSPAPAEEKKKMPAQVTEPAPPVAAAKGYSIKGPSPSVPTGIAATSPVALPRSERLRKRRLIGTIAFYVIFLGVVIPALFFLSLHFSNETRIEGQIIPPPGTMLCNEVWIVTDFRDSAGGIAEDLAAERTPKLQDIQERQDHVQRAQADIAAREERIRLLQEQMQAAKDDIAASIKGAHDAAQKIWDGPGAALEDEYKTRLAQFQSDIAARAKSLNLKYEPDDTYQSPEVWANAYRLALYQTPPGVDGTKEHQWIEGQLKAWRDFTKSFDDRKEKLRLQAAQIQLSPSPKITELSGKIDDLQHRVESTEAEEDPLKTELTQAQADLAQAQSAESGLDGKYYQELSVLPEQSIIKRLPVRANGRFAWPNMEKDAFGQGEKTHAYWLFARAVRKDGRQYWVLSHFSIAQNKILPMLVEPSGFLSTKAILRPDLTPEEQQQ